MIIIVTSHLVSFTNTFIYLTSNYFECWGRSLKGRDCQLTSELDPGDWKLLTPSYPWKRSNFHLSFLLPEAVPRTDLRQWCGVENTCIVYLAELSPLYTLSSFDGQVGDPLLPPKMNLVCRHSLFIKTATYKPGVACLFLSPFPALYLWGLVYCHWTNKLSIHLSTLMYTPK